MSYTNPTNEEIAQRRAELAPFDGWNERAFAQIVAWHGLPKTYLDLGSGTGAMVNFAQKMGVEAYGVDIINGPEHWFITHDLRTPFDIIMRFDIITCLEVGEHLPIESHNVLIKTITRHMKTSGLLIFSAAPPGQGGEHHIGCRPAVEWRTLFHEQGISYRADYTRQLSHLFGWVAGPASNWLAANLMVFDA